MNSLKRSCYAFWVFSFPLLCHGAFLCIRKGLQSKIAQSLHQRELFSPTGNAAPAPSEYFNILIKTYEHSCHSVSRHTAAVPALF